VILGLAIAELCVRTFGEVEPPLRVRDPKLGERYLESFDQRVYSGESGSRVRLRFDQHGFRGPDRPFEKPDGVRRIAILGDSMIAGLAVEEEDTLPGRLESMLERTEVMNFGVTASSPGQALVLHRELVSKFSPDAVVLGFFVGNDLSDSSAKLDHYPRIYFDVDEAGALVQRPYDPGRAKRSSILNRYSRFYVWQKRATNVALQTARQKVVTIPPAMWIHSSAPPPDIEEAWRIVTAIFRAFRDQVKGRFLVLVIPIGNTIYEGAFDQRDPSFDRDQAERNLRAACATAEVECVFLTERFRADAAGRTIGSVKPEDLLYYGGTGHLTPRGYGLAAEVLAKSLSSDHRLDARGQ
jgi:hypothetical protein